MNNIYDDLDDIKTDILYEEGFSSGRSRGVVFNAKTTKLVEPNIHILSFRELPKGKITKKNTLALTTTHTVIN